MTDQPDIDLLRYPFGRAPEPPPAPETEEEIYDTLDYGAIEQDVFLLKTYLLNID